MLNSSSILIGLACAAAYQFATLALMDRVLCDSCRRRPPVRLVAGYRVCADCTLDSGDERP